MEKVTTADGSPIAYEKLGKGPPLVMIHGGVMDHTAWGPVVPLLAAHFTLYPN
jgi:pimeloyl-ACP methyl ester carboxylesterase